MRRARELVREHLDAIKHLADVLNGPAGSRLFFHDNAKATIGAALASERRTPTMVDRVAGAQAFQMVEDAKFYRMVAQRNIAERLHREFPERPFSDVWSASETLTSRGVKEENARMAFEHLIAERSARGITRVSPEPLRLVATRRRG